MSTTLPPKRKSLNLVVWVVIGLVLFYLLESAPQEVELVFELGGSIAFPPGSYLDIHVFDEGGESIRWARLKFTPSEPQLIHRIRLPKGKYRLEARLPGGDLVASGFEVSGRESIPIHLGVYR
ncbi:MAG: hypothetical protein RMJ84_06690 [Sandaracinaceae bacterium]|nr:hypothetical protein [Sandaracinaceae bacterium]